MKNKPKIICLMGPTACGKTRLAIEIVKQLPCEIISVDSAMVYRGMDIGTAKPSKEELQQAPHRLIDICDPAQPYSAGQFRTDALNEIAEIFNRGKIPLLVGGTMLYFHILQNGVADLPQANPTIREQINREAEQLSWPALHEKLCEIDPKLAKQLHPHDSQRIQRALEVYYLTGQRLSDLHAEESAPFPYEYINIIIATNDRTLLHQRIKERFQHMLAQGFIDEVATLFQRGDLSSTLPAIRSVGYRQVWAYLAGEYGYQAMQEQAIIATRQLAKRQFTWLRRWQNAQWFSDENIDSVIFELQKNLMQRWEIFDDVRVRSS